MTPKDLSHDIGRIGRILIALLVTGALLQGCAPLVVGGIATGAAVAHDRRSAGAMLDDQSLELKALDLLMENNPIRSRSNISATSYNYTMLLTGTADSQEIKQQYGEMVERLTGVRRVMNELEVAPNPSFSRISSGARGEVSIPKWSRSSPVTAWSTSWVCCIRKRPRPWCNRCAPFPGCARW